MNLKPMLAVDCGALDKLVFPLLASPKLDGVRCIMRSGKPWSRSLKLIPNRRVHDILAGLPDGLDGELIAGNPREPDAYRKTVSMVMSDDAPIDGLHFHTFDMQGPGAFWPTRYEATCAADFVCPSVMLVPQYMIRDLPELTALEDKLVRMGFEGVILRKPDSPYKHGRSTIREGYLLKLKRFVDGEAVVIGVTELMHNGNAAKKNELGRTDRGHKKAGMVPMNTLGALVVRDVKTGVEFEIGTGFTAEERQGLWHAKEEIVQAGWLAKYKHFPSGAKDKPRHPVFLGWRDKRDV